MNEDNLTQTIMKLIDSEETISGTDIQKKLEKIYGSEFKDKISDAIMSLIVDGILFETELGIYRRAD